MPAGGSPPRRPRLKLAPMNENAHPAGDAQPGNGDRCRVAAGTHKGKSGTVEDLNTIKTGALTLTVRQEDGTRFKTLARNVVVERRNPADG